MERGRPEVHQKIRPFPPLRSIPKRDRKREKLGRRGREKAFSVDLILQILFEIA